MNKVKANEARKQFTEALLEKKDGTQRDMSKLKKVFNAGIKVVVMILLLGVGFLFGDKGMETIERWTGKRNETADANAEPAIEFVETTTESAE